MKHGGTSASSVNKQVTHLVTTNEAFENDTSAVKKAKEYNICIVSENFIRDSIAHGLLANANDYKIGTNSKGNINNRQHPQRSASANKTHSRYVANTR